jgi:hypothetical protein
MSTEKTYGQVAFEAFASKSGEAFTYETTAPEIKDAWEFAANAAVDYYKNFFQNAASCNTETKAA